MLRPLPVPTSPDTPAPLLWEASAPGWFQALQDPDVLAKMDHRSGRAETVSPGPGQYPSEPLFAPRPGATEEDDGYLLSLVYDSRRHASHLAVFDARHLSRGPLARAWFDHHIPFKVHGLWLPTDAL